MAKPKSAPASPLGHLPTPQYFFKAFKRTRKDLTPLLRKEKITSTFHEDNL